MDLAKRIVYENQLKTWEERKRKADSMSVELRRKNAEKIREVELNVARLRYLLGKDTGAVQIYEIPEGDIDAYAEERAGLVIEEGYECLGVDVFRKSRKVIIYRIPRIFDPAPPIDVEMPSQQEVRWEEIGYE